MECPRDIFMSHKARAIHELSHLRSSVRATLASTKEELEHKPILGTCNAKTVTRQLLGTCNTKTRAIHELVHVRTHTRSMRTEHAPASKEEYQLELSLEVLEREKNKIKI